MIHNVDKEKDELIKQGLNEAEGIVFNQEYLNLANF